MEYMYGISMCTNWTTHKSYRCNWLIHINPFKLRKRNINVLSLNSWNRTAIPVVNRKYRCRSAAIHATQLDIILDIKHYDCPKAVVNEQIAHRTQSLMATISKNNSLVHSFSTTRPCNRLEQPLNLGRTMCKGSSPKAVPWVLQNATLY
jgi:hypothetical protein